MEEQSENKEETDNLVEKVLTAGTFSGCFKNLHSCKLDDILLYEINQRLVFTKADRIHHQSVVEFENIAYNRNWGEKEKRVYCKSALGDFMKKRVAPRRKLIENTLVAQNGCRAIGVLLSTSAALGSLVLVPSTYLPAALLGCAGFIGISYFYLKNAKKKRRDEFAINNLFFSESVRLTKAVKTFDVQEFFKKNESLLKPKINQYYDDLTKSYSKH